MSEHGLGSTGVRWAIDGRHDMAMDRDGPAEHVPGLWEARARAAKSYRLARVLVRVCRQAQLDPALLDQAPPGWRRSTAKLAGIHPPSDATWAAAMVLVRGWLGQDGAP